MKLFILILSTIGFMSLTFAEVNTEDPNLLFSDCINYTDEGTREMYAGGKNPCGVENISQSPRGANSGTGGGEAITIGGDKGLNE